MPAKAAGSIKVEFEGDLQVVYFTVTSPADADTTDLSLYFKNILHVTPIPSTNAGVGYTDSAGVITWKISSGTPNLKVRAVGN